MAIAMSELLTAEEGLTVVDFAEFLGELRTHTSFCSSWLMVSSTALKFSLLSVYLSLPYIHPTPVLVSLLPPVIPFWKPVCPSH
jgi:hypothetical protein